MRKASRRFYDKEGSFNIRKNLTKKGNLISALFFVSLIFFIVHTSPPRVGLGVVADTVIKITDMGFEPDRFFVGASGKVIFKNVGKKDHWPASNIHPTHMLYPGSDIKLCATKKRPDLFDSCGALKRGEYFEFTFDRVGVWRYHDHLNPSLKGVVVVGSNEEMVSGNGKEIGGTNKKSTGETWFMVEKFFSRLFVPENGLDDPAADSKSETEELEKEYDFYISRDSEEIFNDRRALFSYVKKYGPSDTVKRLSDLGLKFGFCHNNAHDVGRFAYDLMGGQAFQKCGAECHSGCYHGAIEAYFRDRGTANLVGNFSLLCNEDSNGFFSHQCIHGNVHGLMAWTDYDIYEALESCDLLPYGQSSCRSGVFMENIVGGLASERGHFTKYLNNNPQFPCTVVDEKYINDCYFYQTSRMVELFSGDFSRVAAACLEINPIYQFSCFSSMGRDIGGVNIENHAAAIGTCSLSPKGQLRIACLGGAVQNYFWDSGGQDDAIKFCRTLSDKEEKDSCYATIIGRARDVLSSGSDSKNFCKKVEGVYQNECLSGLEMNKQ